MAEREAKIEKAMRALTELSNDARLFGDSSLLYAANRAWHELDRQLNGSRHTTDTGREK